MWPIQSSRLAAAAGATGAMVLFALGAGPSEILDNLRAYADLVGVPAAWLPGGRLTGWGRGGLLLAALAVLTWTFWPSPRLERTTPASSWLPLSDAPFVLAKNPAYQQMTNLWMPVLLEHALPGGDEPIGFSIAERVTAAEAATVSGAPLVAPLIMWNVRKFGLTWEASGDSFFTCFHPWEVRNERPRYVSVETWEAISDQCAVAWGLLTGGLDAVIKTGAVRVWGRTPSATSPFQIISSDAWQHYRVTDWARGQATGAGGDHLLSIHIEAAQQPPKGIRAAPQQKRPRRREPAGPGLRASRISGRARRR